MNTHIDLLKVLLPELLITHFDIVNHDTKEDILHLYFEEKSQVPNEFKSRMIISHGFHKEISIQDFPIRGRKVFLHIKRRRWLDKSTNEVVQRNWDLVAQGTRMTIEFAAFLKAISSY